MWRNWLSRSPTPSRHSDKERCRSATLPRQQQHQHRDGPEASHRPSSSNTPREKKGRFDFLRPKRWRTLSRSRHTSPKRRCSTSAEDVEARHSSSGSCTPTNAEANPTALPIFLHDSVSTGIDVVTPKAEDENKSIKASLVSSGGRDASNTSFHDSDSKRLSRKDSSKEQARHHTSKPSLFHFAKKTSERTKDQMKEIRKTFDLIRVFSKHG
ncbi:conserved hypothetical protein [Echinococcus multilocularis]|uniref:Uncharacterized protein n=1 Tax=Echinococcus multilocularis TaxID=6211 RepID=A0A068Y598_ECHMU|nr:conserved hypothetical protein [Echinococcus multilocularis]